MADSGQQVTLLPFLLNSLQIEEETLAFLFGIVCAVELVDVHFIGRALRLLSLALFAPAVILLVQVGFKGARAICRRGHLLRRWYIRQFRDMVLGEPHM